MRCRLLYCDDDASAVAQRRARGPDLGRFFTVLGGAASVTNLAPNMFSDRGKVPQGVVSGAVLILTLTAFEDTSGKHFGLTAEDNDRVVSRKTALEGAIRNPKIGFPAFKNRFSSATLTNNKELTLTPGP